jgi:hypothetical protein
MGAAVLLVTLSVAISSLGTVETRRATRPAAIVFTIVSLIFLGYALQLYLWRDRMIRAKSAGSYNDRKGPVVLVAVLAAALIATLVFMQSSIEEAAFTPVNFRKFTAGITIRTGTCDVLATDDIPGESSGSATSLTLPRFSRPTSATYLPR